MANVRGTDGTLILWCRKGEYLTQQFGVVPSSTIRYGFGLRNWYNQAAQNTASDAPLVCRTVNDSRWQGTSSSITKPSVALPALSIPSLGSLGGSGSSVSGSLPPGITVDYGIMGNNTDIMIFEGTPTSAGIYNYTFNRMQQVKNWRGTVQSEWVTYFPVEFHIYAYSYLNLNANGGRFPDQSTVITQTADGYTAPTYTISTTAPTRTGYTFLGWSTSSTATSASYYGGGSYTGVLDGTSTLYAVWSLNTYNVSLTAGTGGTVSGGGTYNYGATANISATPSAHYHFKNWSDGSTSAVRSFTVTGSVSLTAYFEIDTHTVTLTAGTGGTVSGGGTYNYGATATITATPNSHYKFVQWSDGDTNATRNITVTGNISLSATFVKAVASTPIKAGGAWHSGDIYVKVNGAWVESTSLYIKVNGAWVENRG